MFTEFTNSHTYISTNKATISRRFKELINFRALLWILAWRDILVRYKQSLLGIAWAMFIPLSMMLVFTFVFTRVVPLKTDMPYALFAYCGLLPWQFFRPVLQAQQTVSWQTEVYLPRYTSRPRYFLCPASWPLL